MSEFAVEINVRQPLSFVDSDFLKRAISRVLAEEGVSAATISLAIVGDAEIHRVNREFLNHDFPTDVISFLLSDSRSTNGELGDHSTEQSGFFESLPHDVYSRATYVLEGELIVSSETAEREAHLHGWSPRAELLLYVVHGLLHLCGYDDLTDEARPVMRARERELLAVWGFCPTGLET